MDLSAFLQLLDIAIRLTVPLLFACLAGLYSERAGIFDIGLEGKMLISAFAAAASAHLTGNVWLGLLGGIGASVIFALIHGVASITLRGNQLISGVAINFLALGLSFMIGHSLFKKGGQTPRLGEGEKFVTIELPFANEAVSIPVLGEIYQQLISGHHILTYFSFLLVLISWWLLYRTRFGLRLRAVGENPASVDTAGISVVKLRYSAVIICGILCGLAGAYLSTAQLGGFVPKMTADKGFIALAALIFAKWRPWSAMGACLFFGLVEAIGIRFQDVSLFGVKIPGEFMQALPYILTVIILAGFIGKAIPPRAGGVPYVKER